MTPTTHPAAKVATPDDERVRFETAADALGIPTNSVLAFKMFQADDKRDAERYRHMRDRASSLETQQRDKGIVNGPSCYHEVGGIWELKHGDALDAAIDEARLSATPQPTPTKEATK